MTDSLRHVRATRYVEALREGGSVPGLMEADDLGLYVVKLTGAAQGVGALVAEVVVGELARRLDFRIPDLVSVQVDVELARAEPDVEIQELVAKSAGLNLGVDFLPGALPFSPAALAAVDPDLAAGIVWLDALTTNVDRSARNPNLLIWHRNPWLIDHGAALFRQHGERPLVETARDPFPMISSHLLLDRAGSLEAADSRLAGRALEAAPEAVRLVPNEWLGPDPEARRADLLGFLVERLRSPRDFVEEANSARR